jgi:hypothetical protein
MTLFRQFAFSETKLLQLYELTTLNGQKSWWLALVETSIPDKPISQSIFHSQADAIDSFQKAIEGMKQ